jgi:hypothetical protein
MATEDGLDDLSMVFAKVPFSRFPAWESLVRIGGGEENGTKYLELKVPQDGTDRFLYLSTADNEITFGFDLWHTHFGPFLGLKTEDSVAQAIACIESFINQETVVTVCRRDGVWIESGLEYLVAPSALKPHSTNEFFSWCRTHDKTVNVP